MTDMDDNETEAMRHAGDMGGEYLDHLGKTDLAELSLEEWETFVGAVCSGFSEKMLELAEQAYGVGKALKAKVTADDVPY